jgi:hypothetical protein
LNAKKIKHYTANTPVPASGASQVHCVDRPVCFCSTYSCLVVLFWLFGVYKAKAAMARAITLAPMKLDGDDAAPSKSARVLFERLAPVVAAAIPAVALAAPVVVG